MRDKCFSIVITRNNTRTEYPLLHSTCQQHCSYCTLRFYISPSYPRVYEKQLNLDPIRKKVISGLRRFLLTRETTEGQDRSDKMRPHTHPTDSVKAEESPCLKVNSDPLELKQSGGKIRTEELATEIEALGSILRSRTKKNN
ncbi:hypothetical protein RRG08_030713 [Elysia crispata]|uniref:Uncharacterized protein n=1 Tax=Elysia crispata TaxID=231223 RepID=A0AAE0Y486_9GAST|nr:hypothetical protein RRG08_030713 [Elysia crispata]